MPWNLDSARPIYLQIMERVQFDIITGVYQPGDKLPSVRELAAQAAVNPNTMQKALSELERSGLIYSQRTTGRFITEDKELIGQMKQELALSYGWKQVLCVADASFKLFGIHIPALGFLYMFLAILASLAFNILIFYACISIGSLFPNHKVLAAVLCFFGINTLLQFVAGFGIITIFQTKTSQLVLLSTSIGSLLFTIILCIVFYLICHYILDKRLNLS